MTTAMFENVFPRLQAALHSRLPDGKHQVIVDGQRFAGPTLEAAIGQAQARRQQP
jgi:hypothetical protein